MELASGLHWYLKYSCGAHISWDKTGGFQIASIPEPESLPFVRDEGLVFKRPVPWNYYQNVVTSSCEYYSTIHGFHFVAIDKIVNFHISVVLFVCRDFETGT